MVLARKQEIEEGREREEDWRKRLEEDRRLEKEAKVDYEDTRKRFEGYIIQMSTVILRLGRPLWDIFIFHKVEFKNFYSVIYRYHEVWKILEDIGII